MNAAMAVESAATASAARDRGVVPTAAAVAAYIRGTTLLYPVLGSPVAQVKAPMLYNALFANSGLDVAVVPIEIRPEDYSVVFKALFRARNVPGAMVTIPHKAATVALLDGCSDAVRIAGACNAVVRRADGTLYGDLFDGVGFVRAVQRAGFDVDGARCFVAGAGGAGAAIAVALADAQARAVRFHDTRAAHAAELAVRLQARYPRCRIDAGPADVAGFDLVVNATPLGMEPGDPPPVDTSRITPTMTIAEIVMKRDITPFIAAARDRGCRIVLGREMLREQMSLYLRFFGLETGLAHRAMTASQPTP